MPSAFGIMFPVLFVGMWVTVTAVLGVMSGWYRLMDRFPDRPEERPLARFGNQSGTMGGAASWGAPRVNMGGVLTLAVCPGGLRVAIWRLFGPFSRPFFVPWGELAVTRRRLLFWKRARLTIGGDGAGHMEIAGFLADRLARAAAGRWPERGPFPIEPLSETVLLGVAEWALATAFAGGFFTLAPRLGAHGQASPPLVLAVGFPAVVFGLAALVRTIARRGA